MDLTKLQELIEDGSVRVYADNACCGPEGEVQLAHLCSVEGYTIESNVDTGVLAVKLGEDVIFSTDKAKELTGAMAAAIPEKIEEPVEEPATLDIEVERTKFEDKVVAYAAKLTEAAEKEEADAGGIEA